MHIPWQVPAFLLLFATQFVVPKLWESHRKRTIEAWPSVEGNIEKVFKVDWQKASTSIRKGRKHSAELFYTYSVGEKLSGRYSRNFKSEEEVCDFLRLMEGRTLLVRYDPKKPSKSSITEAEIDRLLGGGVAAPLAR